MKFEYDKKQIQRIASEHSYTAKNKCKEGDTPLRDIGRLEPSERIRRENITKRWY